MALNQIPKIQNTESQLRVLRARRQIYAEGKRLLALQLALTVGVPVIGALSTLKWPDLKGAVAFASLVIAILDVTVFDRLQKAMLKTAAKLQEHFDCTVLDLPWDQFSVATKVAPETIHDASTKYLGGRDDPTLIDWYPPVVGEAPLHLARIICQRTNLWYDAKVRRWYGGWVIGVMIAIVMLLFVIGIIGGQTLDTFVLTALAPAAPIIIWGVREYLRQRDATEGLDRVRSEAEALWNRAKLGACSEAECTAQSRQFQSLIYERRSLSPLVFSWIYKIKRPRLEDQMNKGAEDFVRDIPSQAEGDASA
ncbi:hypothetical protein ACVWXO_001818 [Bradyrhizobium sp. LM2.7]